ncbi:DUF4389 domain-containing protein [Phycicoccus sp. HDW14]|uniref:DUF4389 domain-containing protein n=1 Tax=Phycicoccus sp. HDW14 TaxID=2714941 RepID=UPI00140A6E87|nr:DUF4389 domain-containing protein [Phycicoccus sp. HDW14]QIM20786.1 DUF4389 domain-containing protein [Phycicoccus sp. HDW14]
MSHGAPQVPARSPDYPARLDVDYPERLDRLSTLLRLVYVIPVAVVLSLVTASATSTTEVYRAGEVVERTTSTGGGITGGLFVATALMILVRQRYSRWWFDFLRELTRFSTRVGAYVVLLSDAYPSTEDEQSVHLDLDYPDARTGLNRWLPLVKWFLAIPHYVVLVVLGVGAVVAVVVAWFAILVTGRYPRALFDYVVGVGRWGLRVQAYAFLLLTDAYPPFRLS